MSDEQRNELKSLMNDISQLDEQSFIQIQFAASVLLARERQVTLSKEKAVVYGTDAVEAVMNVGDAH